MPAGAKRTAQKADKRRRIIDAAQAMFQLLGYEGTNLRDIAKSAGCSTGAVFSNFADKEQLFEEATGRKAPMARVKDALIGVAKRGEVPPWGASGAATLLQDLYGSDA